MSLFDKLADATRAAMKTAQNAAGTAMEQAQQFAASDAASSLKNRAGEAADAAIGLAKGAREKVADAQPSTDQTGEQGRSGKAKGAMTRGEEGFSFPKIDLVQMMQSACSSSGVKPEEALPGQAREFTLCGARLEVPAPLDKCVAYRSALAPLAESQLLSFKAGFVAEVCDLQTLCAFAPAEYCLCASPLLDKAASYLLGEGVWDVSQSELVEAFVGASNFASFWNELDVQAEKMTADQNVVMDMRDDGFVGQVNGQLQGMSQKQHGTFGAIGTLLTSVTVDSLMKKYEDRFSEIKRRTGLIHENQTRLYGAIDLEKLLDFVRLDYRNATRLFIGILHAKGVDVWVPDARSTSRSSVMLANLRNADFSQEPVARVMCEVLLADPFNEDAYRLLDEKLPGSAEVSAIRSYFMPDSFVSV